MTNKLNFGLVAKSPLYGHEDIATLSAGIGVSLNNKDVSLKTGFELNINLWFKKNIVIINPLIINHFIFKLSNKISYF